MYAFLFLPFAHFSEGQAPFCVAGDGGGDLIARLFVFFLKLSCFSKLQKSVQ